MRLVHQIVSVEGTVGTGGWVQGGEGGAGCGCSSGCSRGGSEERRCQIG